MVDYNFELKIIDERIHEWGLPTYATPMSAGIDLYACCDETLLIEPQAKATLISSGIAVNMGRADVVAMIYARSGLGHKKGLVLGNGTGVIDADYQNTIFISTWNRNPVGSDPIEINPGDRIAQLVFMPILQPNLDVVKNFTGVTERGLGGFGSTGV